LKTLVHGHSIARRSIDGERRDKTRSAYAGSVLMQDDTIATERPKSLADLFITFTLLALQGFGGVLAISQRVLCDQKRWLSKEQFVEILAVGQVLPGPNICNMALIIGDRFLGARGAFAALAGMMAVPLVLVLAITALYVHHAADPHVSGALRGMGAVSAGLIAGTALRLSSGLRGNVMSVGVSAALTLLSFTGVALMRWPLVWVLLTLGTAAGVFAWMRLGRKT
jgi:chromate transporter